MSTPSASSDAGKDAVLSNPKAVAADEAFNESEVSVTQSQSSASTAQPDTTKADDDRRLKAVHNSVEEAWKNEYKVYHYATNEQSGSN